MKTAFILLACLQVIIEAGSGFRFTDAAKNIGAEIEKKCNNKAEEIASQDCKQRCNEAELEEDCAKCINNHRDYDDDDCKGSNYMLRHCLEIFDFEGDCNYNVCPLRYARGKEFNKCKMCLMSHQYSLACFIHTLEFFDPTFGVAFGLEAIDWKTK